MVRLEQLSPYPYDLVLREIRRYPKAQVCWLQEEPKNMGAYAHFLPRSGDCSGREREREKRVPY